MQKLLTISIPTWNRSMLLESLVSQLTVEIVKLGLADKIEILISNNASEDDTENIVTQFQGKYNFITYNRNVSNIGAKSNVLKSMEMANSEFVLFIGDDDKINTEKLPMILSFLECNLDAGVIIDQANFKNKQFPSGTSINLESLLSYYYWLIGNAGFFILKSIYVKQYLQKYGYDFFNECWPQTQLVILGLRNSSDKCFVMDWGIQGESLHGDVMIYNSFYLWRTCYFDLLVSINDLKSFIEIKSYNASRTYMKNSLIQQLFNILQCGIFVDDKHTRKKTYKHILKHIGLFSAYEKIFLTIISIALMLPVYISKPLSNLFILLLKGKTGIQKKNEFVQSELKKKNKLISNSSKSIRTLEFEK